MDTIKCPRCGADIATDSKFCNLCGAEIVIKVEEAVKETAEEIEQHKKEEHEKLKSERKRAFILSMAIPLGGALLCLLGTQLGDTVGILFGLGLMGFIIMWLIWGTISTVKFITICSKKPQ